MEALERLCGDKKEADNVSILKETQVSFVLNTVGTTVGTTVEISKDFLKKLAPEYSSVKKSNMDLSPLNDSCERALGMATRFNSKI